MVVDIGGVRLHGVSELLHAVHTKPLSICCGFAADLKLNFGFSNLGEGGPLWGWAFVVSDRITEPLGVCCGFAAVFNIMFLITPFLGKGCSRGSTMVPLSKELVSFHRLSIQTTLVYIW